MFLPCKTLPLSLPKKIGGILLFTKKNKCFGRGFSYKEERVILTAPSAGLHVWYVRPGFGGLLLVLGGLLGGLPGKAILRVVSVFWQGLPELRDYRVFGRDYQVQRDYS